MDKIWKNPYGLATENTYVNPDKSLWQESPEIDYTKWLEEDFTYQKIVSQVFQIKAYKK